MINKIRLRAFKCFLNAEFECRRLTLLTGYNGAGKSSLLQALLMWRVAAKYPLQLIPLNCFFGTDLGTVQDVLCTEAVPDDRMHICIEDERGEHNLQIRKQSLDDMFLSVEHCDPGPTSFTTTEAGFFTYLAAERHGPRLVQRRQSADVSTMQVGTHGEYVAEVLAWCETSRFAKKVPVAKRHTSTKEGDDSFRRQVELWMGEWIPGVQFRATFHPHGVSTLEVGARGISSEWVRPENTGFGISYSLPIIVAGLLAPDGGVLIVDSPEAHLHPSGQTAIGRFLATMAQAGVQVFIETHSEHVLNGVRQIVRREGLSPDDTKIHFFGRNSDGAIERHQPHLDKFGKVHGWPDGFFDEQEKVLMELL